MKAVYYVGYNVFPFGFAQTQRELLISKGLVELGCKVTVLCRYGTYGSARKHVPASGVFEGVNYKYASGNAHRSDSFIKRNIVKAFGAFNEVLSLVTAKLTGNLDAILITTNTFGSVLLYTILGKILFTQTIIDNTEYWTAVKRHKNAFGDEMYDKYSYRLASKVICISDFLMDVSRKGKSEAKLLKIPCIVDFAKFTDVKPGPEINAPYFLFCGSAVYYPVIEFIIDSFNQLNDNHYNLILVSSNGAQSDYQRITDKIAASDKKHLIHFKSNISYDELVGLYQHGFALLIPLRETSEDTARFPHKIGEYCASKRPIVSTAFGEVVNYFQSGVNAYLSERFNTADFAATLQLAIASPTQTEEIAKASYHTGRENFDYKACGQKVYNFIYQ